MPSTAARRLATAVVPGYALLLSLVVLAPLFAPGYVLLRDAVSTPRSFLTPSAVGLGETAARAVPQDAFVAVLSHVVDGGIVVKVLLAAALFLAGWGAARMAATLWAGDSRPSLGVGAQCVAVTVAVWNPFVAERLLQGHWSLLLGYAALAWTVVAAHQARSPRGWVLLGFWLAVAGITPTGAVLAGIVAVVVLAVREPAGRWRRVGIGAGLWGCASLPWLVSALLSGSGAAADPAGVSAFAARAEPGLGTVGSLAGLGGIWNADAVPGSRAGLVAFVGTTVLLLIVVGGAVVVLRAGVPLARPLLWVAVLAVALPALAATGAGIAVAEWASTNVPGAGLLRDGQKWVALAMPFYALCAAAATTWAARHVPVAAAAFCVLLIAVLPDLVWGVGGQVRPVVYPPAWAEVRDLLADDDSGGTVAVLPAGMFRVFPFSGTAPVLDPAPRWLPREVLTTGDLRTSVGVVAGEGGRARAVEQALLAGRPAEALAAAGVGWVLVEENTPGERGESAATLAHLELRYADAELALYRVPGPVAEPSAPSAAHWGAAAFAHAVWALMLAAGAVALCTTRGARWSGVR